MRVENREIKGRKNIYISIEEIIEKFNLKDEQIKSFYVNIDNEICFQCLEEND